MANPFFRFFSRTSSSEAPPDAAGADVGSRRSSGLGELNRLLKGSEGLAILDLGPTSPANITHFTELGHRVYNEDVLLGSQNAEYKLKSDNGQPSVDVDRFFKENLVFRNVKFDAVLCWDIPDYLAEPLVKPMIERIASVMNPKGYLLSFFHTKDAGPDAPYVRYHISGADTLRLQRGPNFRLQRVFNNRHIENLFHDYASLKFFLARDNVREVLVVR
ncbi:MAG: SAM-dependent methyltransferase [Acidobacteria bacterium]|nr:SAM-dependent methyltransferase [Acidobacteriota bacterium]MBV9144961.1 SAM-dependent methyltransferase [Acidobacteriota bacterium]